MAAIARTARILFWAVLIVQVVVSAYHAMLFYTLYLKIVDVSVKQDISWAVNSVWNAIIVASNAKLLQLIAQNALLHTIELLIPIDVHVILDIMTMEYKDFVKNVRLPA